MGWALLRSGSAPFDLPNDGIAHIVLAVNNTAVGVVLTLHPQMQTELARIVTGPYGAKLEAISDAIDILPGESHAPSTINTAADPRTKSYELQPRVGEHSEAIFLRHGDTLNFPGRAGAATYTCQWTDSEVQVNSSVTDAVQVAESAEADGVADTPEEETEDEDLDDNTITAAPLNQKKSQSRATPQLPNQRSVVVQETPTAVRVKTPSFSPAPTDHEKPEPETEAFSTVRTGESQDRPSARRSNLLPNAGASPTIDASVVDSTIEKRLSRHSRTKISPQVLIPPKSSRKRATPVIEDEWEAESEAVSRGNKRAKRSDDDTQDSRMSNVDVDLAPPWKTPAKAKTRQSEVAKTEVVAEAEDATPARSQRSSQRSTTSVSAEPYEGPTPRVAFSNSGIATTGHVVKFLKKRGTFVENLTDDFDVLCAKDGDLRKTSKVLLAIAHGIPIVTDKWLLDSAKATYLLSISAYKLSAPKQEKDWNFKLDDVLGQPQAPFKDHTMHFTKSLKASYKPFTEIETVCKSAGVKSITSKRTIETGDTIVLALDDEDPEAQKLIQDGVKCYHRDLIAYSILRGSLDLDSDEFRIEGAAAEAPKEKKRKGRKST